MELVKFSNNENSTVCTDDKLVENYGKHVYKTYNSMRCLANVMEHPEFRKFVDKYLLSADVYSMILFMKMYKKVEELYPWFSPYQKLGFIHTLITCKTTRKKIRKVFGLDQQQLMQ